MKLCTCGHPKGAHICSTVDASGLCSCPCWGYTPAADGPDLPADVRTVFYRVERQEMRVKHPHYGKWCQDSSTTFRLFPELELMTALELVRNPTGDLAFQPRRLIRIVTTESVYETTEK